MLATTLMLAAVLLGPAEFTQSSLPESNSTTYASRSGDFTLCVEPSAEDGAGGAECRLFLEGEPVWSKRLPFTFGGAAVGDNGVVVGYAYSDGKRGRPVKGDLVIASVSARGVTTLMWSSPRGYDGHIIPGSSPHPMASGVLIDARMDRAHLLVNEQVDSFATVYVFVLSSGRLLRRLNTRSLRIVETSVLPGMPLLLVRAWTDGWMSGAQFSIVNYEKENGFGTHRIWSLERSQDYRGFETRSWSDTSKSFLDDFSAILSTSLDGEFSLWLEADGVQAEYEVEYTEGEWVTREVARSPFSVPPPTAAKDQR